MKSLSVGGRHLFMLDVDDAPDALARIITPFAVVQAHLERVDYHRHELRAAVWLEVSGISWQQAELLRKRLEGLILTRSVGLGWRCTQAE